MRIIALLAGLGALASTCQAHAAERVASFPANGRQAVAGPVPVGGEVAYGHRLASGRWWIGTTARTHAVLPAPGTGLVANVVLAASRQRVAWARTVESARQGRIPEPPVQDGLFSLQPPGGPAPVDTCPPPEECRVHGTGSRFAIDGSALAWLRWAFPASSAVTIDPGDGDAPKRMDLGEADPTGPIAAAGDRVAFATTDRGPYPDDPARITVLDHGGRELLRVESSDALTFGDRHRALQPDCPRGCRGTVSVARRDAPLWKLARRRVAFGPSRRARPVRLGLGRVTARALRRADPRIPVLLMRFAGRDGTGEAAVAERPRTPRTVR